MKDMTTSIVQCLMCKTVQGKDKVKRPNKNWNFCPSNPPWTTTQLFVL